VPISWAVWFALGACVGSFLNVCIWRLPREQSIVRPRSRCPQCSRLIAWYDNVPLISYVLLQGRCRHCRRRIHWRYPVVEGVSGLASVAVFHRFGVGLVGAVYLFFVWALIVVSFIDLEHRIIPAEITVIGLMGGVVASIVAPQLHETDQVFVSLIRSTHGALVGAGLLYVTGTIGTLVFRKEAMGLGDVDLFAMAGSILGWKLVTVTFFIAPVLAVLPGVVVLIRKKSHEIPYGPFLSLGLVLSLFFGEWLIQMSGVEELISLFWTYYQ